jgi:hypothetical protein
VLLGWRLQHSILLLPLHARRQQALPTLTVETL